MTNPMDISFKHVDITFYFSFFTHTMLFIKKNFEVFVYIAHHGYGNNSFSTTHTLS